MAERSLKTCIWAGPLSGMLFGLAIWPLARFIPLLDPMYPAEQIVAIYQANTIGIRLGAIVMAIGAAFNAAFFGAIFVFIRRIEGENGPYAITQAMAGAVLVAFIFLPAMLFGVTAFRPERAPELTLMLNDFAWLALVIPTPPGVVQGLAIGFAILGDRRANPLLPRWAGYMSLWMAVLTLPAPFALMFKSGPFAWNGVLAFWLPAGIAGMWLVVMTVAMLRAAGRAVSPEPA